MFFRQIFDDKLAQYAYLIGCQQTGEAIVVDPERDIDRYLDLAEREGLRIVAVAETHIHADFLSGGREFADRLGTKLYLSDEGDENWKYEWATHGDYDDVPLRSGDVFRIGNIEFETVHTPGHTPEHVAFLVTDRGSGATQPMGLLSGDFVFVGDLGRPDLLETAAGVQGAMEPAARLLYGSVQQFLELPEFLQVWPAHGAGSACGKALGAVPETTVGYEKRFSPAIDAARRGEDAFVSFILEGQPEPPMYFARMKRDNKLGPPILGDLPSPRKLSAEGLGSLAGTDLVIDTRANRSEFMTRHIPGSIYVPLTKSFNSAVGSIVEEESTSIVLIIDEEDLAVAIRDLIRIGYDNISAYAEPETLERYFEAGGDSASIAEVDFGVVKEAMTRGAGQVLDVRYASEHASGHVPGAINASYTRLPEYIDRISGDGPLFVHCQTGARAAVAVSYLAREGRDVRYVNDLFTNYAASSPSEAESGQRSTRVPARGRC